MNIHTTPITSTFTLQIWKTAMQSATRIHIGMGPWSIHTYIFRIFITAIDININTDILLSGRQ